MKRTIIKVAVFLATFLISLIAISRIMNKGNYNMTMEMAPATFPIVTMEQGELSYNQLHGYRETMETAFQRDCITALGSDREVEFRVDTYGMPILGISVEVRSVDGKRLIENSPVTDLKTEGQEIYGRITLKDLIEQDKEYALVILLETQEDEYLRYYTRIVSSDSMHAEEKLQFVLDFHQKLYDKEAAKELSRYLEPDSTGDNTSFHKVNIHSSFQQVTWGDLQVREEITPTVRVTELASQTSSIVLDYVVSTSEGRAKTYYRIEEYYRVRYTTDRMYLLDYERTMTQIPDVEGNMYGEDKILLGIVAEDTPIVESEDGNNVVFSVANRLCSYNVTNNKLAILFSFYDEENMDVRTFYQQHDIKILDVDEGGNVRFAVYGYMNRGRHEGEVGIQIYSYDSSLNTIEESVYLPYSKSYAVLKKEMEQLLYMNRENKLYIFLENMVYGIDLDARTYEKITTVHQDGRLQVSDNHKILVWQNGEDIYHSTGLVLKNLSSGKEKEVKAAAGEYILPLGFMGEDIIYGIARREDVITDNTGRVFFPMYKAVICNSDGEVLKEYKQEGAYITGCSVEANQITLMRVRRLENGTYTELEEDHIMNNVNVVQGKNKLVVVSIEKYEKYVQIQVSKAIESKSIKILTPKEVVFEGGRELVLEERSGTPRYYVYGSQGVEGIYNAPAEAVQLAYSVSGTVVGESGECIWLKGNRAARNQIMAITKQETEEGQSSLAVCLDTIFKLEGMVRDSQSLLNQGKTVTEILEENLEDRQVLDLTGCPMDAVLYYVNRDIPVLATLENGEAVLITGFNEFNIVVMDPAAGTLEKKGMNDSKEWFLQNGNCFITYTRQE